MSGAVLALALAAFSAGPNKEIAAELFLAPKTIENHLSRIFGKLGVRGRAAVAGAIASARPPTA